MPLILLKTSERIKAFTYTMNTRLYREVLQEALFVCGDYFVQYGFVKVCIFY